MFSTVPNTPYFRSLTSVTYENPGDVSFAVDEVLNSNDQVPQVLILFSTINSGWLSTEQLSSQALCRCQRVDFLCQSERNCQDFFEAGRAIEEDQQAWSLFSGHQLVWLREPSPSHLSQFKWSFQGAGSPEEHNVPSSSSQKIRTLVCDQKLLRFSSGQSVSILLFFFTNH